MSEDFYKENGENQQRRERFDQAVEAYKQWQTARELESTVIAEVTDTVRIQALGIEPPQKNAKIPKPAYVDEAKLINAVVDAFVHFVVQDGHLNLAKKYRCNDSLRKNLKPAQIQKIREHLWISLDIKIK